MTEKNSLKSYRIGDFAEYMGVTPDFLKHYSENGLLDVHQRENGYRYYSFDQASRILEYMRLRNYGVSVKEMHAMLAADADEAVRLLDIKVDEMQRQADHLLAVIEEHKRLYAWQQRRARKPVDWEVKHVEPMLFLPHTEKDHFIVDKRISELLKVWMGWLPIAKSVLFVEPTKGEVEPYKTSWGVGLPESIALRYAIPSSEVVLRTPASKAFIYHFVAEESAFNMKKIASGIHPAFELMNRLNLEPAGSGTLVVEMKLINPDGSRRGGYGRFVLPVAG